MSEHGASAVVADVLCDFFEVAIHMILFIRGIYPPELFESTQKYNCPIKTARHPGLINYIQQVVQSIRSELQKDSIHRICVVILDSAGDALDRFVFEMGMLRPFDEHILDAINQQGHGISGSSNSLVDKGKDKGKAKATDDRYHNVPFDETDLGNYSDYEDEPLYRTTAQGRLAIQMNQQQFPPLNNRQYLDSAASRSREVSRFGAMMTLTTDVEVMFKAMLLKISSCDSYLKPVDQDCSFTVVIEMKSTGNGPDAKPEFPWSPISATIQKEQSKLSPGAGVAVHNSPDRKIIPVKTIDIADIQFELFIERMETSKNVQ